jgi:hypothetical protein
MVDAKHTSIEILMTLWTASLIGKQHYVAVIRVWIDGILGSSYVIRSVIDPHDAMSVKALAFEMDAFKFMHVASFSRAWPETSRQ